MSDRDENGQEAFHCDMLKRQQEEEEALRHVIQGVATVKDAEILAIATGHDFKQLMEAA